MAFTVDDPLGLDRHEETDAVGSQSCDAPLCLRPRRLRGPSEHLQLREFRVEIDDAGRSAFHVSLHNRLLVPLPRIVAPQFDCSDLRFRSRLESFLGNQFDGYELPSEIDPWSMARETCNAKSRRLGVGGARDAA